MPDEPEVVVAPIKTPGDPVAEGPEEASPEVPVEGTGEAVAAEPEGNGFDPQSLSTEEWDYLLRHAPPDKVAETDTIRNVQRSAEQRAETRLREEMAARQATQDGTSQLIQIRQQADQVLDQIERQIPYDFRDLERYVADGDTEKAEQTRVKIQQTLDPAYLKQLVAARDAGMYAELGLRQAQEAVNILADIGGPLVKDKPFTPQEEAELAQARYEDTQRGTLGLRSQRKVIELLLARHGESEYERGRESGLKDKAAQATLADKMARIKEIQNGADPGRITGGQAQTRSGPLTLEEAQTLPLDELRKRELAQ